MKLQFTLLILSISGAMAIYFEGPFRGATPLLDKRYAPECDCSPCAQDAPDCSECC